MTYGDQMAGDCPDCAALRVRLAEVEGERDDLSHCVLLDREERGACIDKFMLERKRAEAAESSLLALRTEYRDLLKELRDLRVPEGRVPDDHVFGMVDIYGFEDTIKRLDALLLDPAGAPIAEVPPEPPDSPMNKWVAATSIPIADVRAELDRRGIDTKSAMEKVRAALDKREEKNR